MFSKAFLNLHIWVDETAAEGNTVAGATDGQRGILLAIFRQIPPTDKSVSCRQETPCTTLPMGELLKCGTHAYYIILQLGAVPQTAGA